MRSFLLSVALVVMGIGCTCGVSTVDFDGGQAGHGGTGGAGGGAGGHGGAGGGSGGGTPTWLPDGGLCPATGPVVTVTWDAGAVTQCAGQLASTTFVSALCTCHDVVLAGYLKSAGFNSRLDGGLSQLGGSVGINGSYRVGVGDTDVGGSLSVAGSESMNFAGYLQSRGDLRLAPPTNVAGVTEVGRDAWLESNFVGVGTLNVGRDLHYGAALLTVPQVHGSSNQQAVSVAPPCPCSGADLIDVPALVADGRAHNDNTAIALDPAVLKNVLGPVNVTLPCGRYYLDEISGGFDIDVNVTGKVAVFVQNKVAALGRLRFHLAPMGELDLFIAGDLDLVGDAVFGDRARPAATRIYVGGTGDVTLVGAVGFVGNVYAPRAKVTAVGFADVAGSIVAWDFVSPGYARFAYDKAISSAGSSCPPVNLPPGVCRTCTGCTNGQACMGGSCGDCQSDSDCCEQMVCTQGRCEPIFN